jgi:hypothetical protein
MSLSGMPASNCCVLSFMAASWQLRLRNGVGEFQARIWEGGQCHHQTALVGGPRRPSLARQAGHTVTSGPLALNHAQQARQRRFVITLSSRFCG